MALGLPIRSSGIKLLHILQSHDRNGRIQDDETKKSSSAGDPPPA